MALIVIMGVSGSGKTTVGSLLARRLGYLFRDADDFHSVANRKKMHAGIPLCDEDRETWLVSLNRILVEWDNSGTNGVLACSALKLQHRTALRVGIETSTLQFVHLSGRKELIAERLAHRSNHFMSPHLLESQFEAMECPDHGKAIDVSIEPAPEQIVEQILDRLSC